MWAAELIPQGDQIVFCHGGTIRQDSHDLAHLSLAYPLCLMEKHFKVKNVVSCCVCSKRCEVTPAQEADLSK